MSFIFHPRAATNNQFIDTLPSIMKKNNHSHKKRCQNSNFRTSNVNIFCFLVLFVTTNWLLVMVSAVNISQMYRSSLPLRNKWDYMSTDADLCTLWCNVYWDLCEARPPGTHLDGFSRPEDNTAMTKPPEHGSRSNEQQHSREQNCTRLYIASRLGRH